MSDSAGAQVAILLVDDHALFRESIARLLAAEGGFRIAASCQSLEEAVEVLQKTHVDIVLLDFDLGPHDGEEFMRSARHTGFQGKVLVVTAGLENNEAAELIRSGVSGIFTKRESPTTLIEAIRDVLAGKVWFDRSLLQQVVVQGQVQSERLPEQFTEREREVLSHILNGLANKEIAERMGATESAVKATLQQLFAKTGVRTRSQLVRVALERYRNQL